MRKVIGVEIFAGHEAVVGGKIIEEALVVGALTILQTLELDLARLNFFCVVDLFSQVGEIGGTEMIEDVELKSPDNVRGVFDVAAFFERRKRDGADVVVAIETADDDEGRIGVALKFFELADGIINAELGRFATGGDDLEVVETNDGSFGLVGTERLEQSEQVVDRFVLKFQDAELELVVGKIVDDVFKLNRPSTAANVGGGQFGGRNTAEKFAGDGLGKKFELAHLVRTENTRLSLPRELFEQLPAEGRFAGSGSRTDDVKPWIEKLKSVEVIEARTAIGIIFQLVDFGLKMIGEEVAEGKFLGRDEGAADLVESQLGFGDDVGRRELSEVGVLADDFGGDNESAQVGFLLDDFGVVLGEGGGVGGVDEVEQVQVVDFFVVAVLAELLFDGEEFDGFAGGVKADDGFENELVFGSVKVVGVEDGENFGHD